MDDNVVTFNPKYHMHVELLEAMHDISDTKAEALEYAIDKCISNYTMIGLFIPMYVRLLQDTDMASKISKEELYEKATTIFF